VRSIFEHQSLTLKDGVERLENAGLNYMLTGSVAMIRFAMMRMTNDIDIVVELAQKDREKIIRAFADNYYVPEEKIAGAIERRSMFNVISQSTFVKIDLVIRKDDPFQIHAFSRREKTKIWDVDLWAIQKDDLILSKLNWAKDSRSELQMRDVSGIMMHGFDSEYVRGWASKLGVSDLYDECIKLSGNDDVERHNS